MKWIDIGHEKDLIEEGGVCALINGIQIAIFRLGKPDRIFAIDNFDPKSGVHALSRGIVGSHGSHITVASPIYKHHYDLRTGICLEDHETRVNTWPVKIHQNRILLGGHNLENYQ